MRIVVNHLTRMREGHICVAGIRVETKQHIRPVLPRGNLSSTMLKSQRGCFGVGYLVDLGTAKAIGRPPAIEDTLFAPEKASQLGRMSPPDFWDLLKVMSKTSLRDIFGAQLETDGWNAVIKAGVGQVSLGNLILRQPPHIYVTDDGRLRIQFSDKAGSELILAVTDVRFYEGDHWLLKRAAVEHAARWCKEGGQIILSVGLSRLWQKPSDSAPRHWLQVNNLHFENNPFW